MTWLYPALSGDGGDNILGMNKSTDLESYQLDLGAGSAIWKVHDLWKVQFYLISLTFLTGETGIIIAHHFCYAKK